MDSDQETISDDLPQLLPNGILRHQFCHACFQHLSVPPIVINNLGEVLCGRCCNLGRNKPYYKSLFNTVAEGFLFPCSNQLNGCQELCDATEIARHENECKWENQNCFFCPFYGNLSQILNHCQKAHPDNVSFGLIPFALNELMEKKILLTLDCKMFLLNVKVTKDQFTMSIKSVTKPLPNGITQFGIKFFNAKDPTSYEMLYSDYFILNIKFESYFIKPLEELASAFDHKTTTFVCQIVIDSLVLEAREMEFQKRFAKLCVAENNVRHAKQIVNNKEQKISQLNDKCNAALDILKMVWTNIFRCSVCQKIVSNEMYFCVKVHPHCQNCLTTICKVCNVPRTFKKMKNIEEFVVECDWTGCVQSVNLVNYPQHKLKCSYRPFYCPIAACKKLVLSSVKLIDHWHSNILRLLDGDEILFETYQCEELFWLINDDLYKVSVQFNVDWIEILIEEINVLQLDLKFKCEGNVSNSSNYDSWRTLQSRAFCGKFQINMTNSLVVAHKDTKMTQIKISVAKY